MKVPLPSSTGSTRAPSGGSGNSAEIEGDQPPVPPSSGDLRPIPVVTKSNLHVPPMSRPASKPSHGPRSPASRARGLLLILVASLFGSLLGGCGDSDAELDGAEGAPPNPLLRPAQFTETAPARFAVRFETTAGEFVVDVHRDWAPLGTDRFYNLVRAGYYDDTRVYRVVPGFMAQFGIHGDPFVHRAWSRAPLRDDPVTQSNARGRVTFAKAGRNSRTAEIFISTVDNSRLDADGFAPFGEVVEGMETVDAFHSGYGDGPPRGSGPYAAMAHARGNEYLDEEYPELTRILRASVVEP